MFCSYIVCTVFNIWSGSKKLIKVVLRQERILGQLWWKVLIHFKCWLVCMYLFTCSVPLNMYCIKLLFIFNWLLMFTTAQWHHWYRRPSWSSTSSAAAGGSCPLAACTASQGQHSVPGTDARACSTTADPATVPAGYSTASASTGAIFLVLLNLLVVLNLRG